MQVRTRLLLVLLALPFRYQAEDFTWLGMPIQGSFREDQFPINCDLKHTARTSDKLNVGVGERFLDFSRQTGSSRFIVSDCAVFDRDPHCSSSDGKFIKLWQ